MEILNKNNSDNKKTLHLVLYKDGEHEYENLTKAEYEGFLKDPNTMPNVKKILGPKI